MSRTRLSGLKKVVDSMIEDGYDSDEDRREFLNEALEEYEASFGLVSKGFYTSSCRQLQLGWKKFKTILLNS